MLGDQSVCEAQVEDERPAQALSTLSKYASNDQQQCRSNAVVRAGQNQHQALGEGLNIISRRALQFSMHADAIVSSGDVTLGELAVQLHAPVPKLRMWGASWRRISGQQQEEMESAATAAVALESSPRDGRLASSTPGAKEADAHGPREHSTWTT